MEFINTLIARHSTRKFRSDAIPDVIMYELLESVRMEPSDGDSQNCVVGIVTQPELKARLADAAGHQDWIATAPVVFALCSRLENSFLSEEQRKFNYELDAARFGKEFMNHINSFPDQKAADIYKVNSCPLIPGEHLFLAAVNRGLGACWIGHLDVGKASEVLELPDNMACLFLMPVGFPAEEPEAKDRKSIDEIVFYETWNSGKNSAI